MYIWLPLVTENKKVFMFGMIGYKFQNSQIIVIKICEACLRLRSAYNIGNVRPEYHIYVHEFKHSELNYYKTR